MALFPLWRILILVYFDLFILLCLFCVGYTFEGSEGLFLLGVPSMTATRAMEGNCLYLILWYFMCNTLR